MGLRGFVVIIPLAPRVHGHRHVNRLFHVVSCHIPWTKKPQSLLCTQRNPMSPRSRYCSFIRWTVAGPERIKTASANEPKIIRWSAMKSLSTKGRSKRREPSGEKMRRSFPSRVLRMRLRDFLLAIKHKLEVVKLDG